MQPGKMANFVRTVLGVPLAQQHQFVFPTNPQNLNPVQSVQYTSYNEVYTVSCNAFPTDLLSSATASYTFNRQVCRFHHSNDFANQSATASHYGQVQMPTAQHHTTQYQNQGLYVANQAGYLTDPLIGLYDPLIGLYQSDPLIGLYQNQMAGGKMVHPRKNQKCRFDALQTRTPTNSPKPSKIQPNRNFGWIQPVTLPPPLQPELRAGGHVTSFMRSQKTLNWVADSACFLLDGSFEELPEIHFADPAEIPMEVLTLYDELLEPEHRVGRA